MNFRAVDGRPICGVIELAEFRIGFRQVW